MIIRSGVGRWYVISPTCTGSVHAPSSVDFIHASKMPLFSVSLCWIVIIAFQFGVGDGYFCVGGGEVEHVEDDGFGTSVLAAVDRADDFDQGFAFVEGFLGAILADDGQVALLHDAVVDDRVVVPAGFGTDGKVQTNDSQFGLTLRKIG